MQHPLSPTAGQLHFQIIVIICNYHHYLVVAEKCWPLVAGFAAGFPCRGRWGAERAASPTVLQSHFARPCFVFLGCHLLPAVNILQRDLMRRDKDKVLLNKFLGAVNTWKGRWRVPGVFVMHISAVPGDAARFDDAGYFRKPQQGAMCSSISWDRLLCHCIYFFTFCSSILFSCGFPVMSLKVQVSVYCCQQATGTCAQMLRWQDTGS